MSPETNWLPEDVRTILNAIPDAVFIHDAQTGAVLHVNERTCADYGYTYEEVCRLSIGDLSANTPPYTLGDALGYVASAQRGEQPVFEWLAKAKCGRHFWMEVSLRPLDIGGRQLVVATARDISARKRNEQTLRERDARLRAITANIPMVFFGLDESGKFTFSEGRGLVRLGLEPGQLVGASAFEVYQRYPAIVESVRDALAGKLTETIQDTGDLVFHVYYTLLPEAGEPGTRVIGIAVDITEQRRAQDALKQSEEYNKILFAESHVPIVIIDPETAHVVDCNHAAIRVHGMSSREEVLRSTPASTSAPFQYDGSPSGEAAWKHLQTTLEKGSDFFEWRQRRPTGEEWDAEVHLLRMNYQGRVLIQCTVNDITERRRALEEKSRLETQLRQSQKMEAVGQLAGGVAHDFNNLLQVINGFTDLALDQIGIDHPASECLRQVLEAGNRAATLVAQLLTFSRRQVIQPEVLDLNEVVRRLLKLLGRVLGENIRLDFVPGHALRRIHADRGMMEQVIMNLCVNARDAMIEGGELLIESRNVSLDSEFCAGHTWATPGDYVQLSVSDTGCGMDTTMFQHIFEPFFTTKGPGHGTGLGLATVYGIVKQHNGLINVYSEIGKGTRFQVCMPVCDMPQTAAPIDALESGGGGSETILLAEDDPSVRDLARTILEQAGYTVIEASNGEEAVSLADDYGRGIDLLLFDVVMPNMGGREAYERIRSAFPAIPVLFASGYSESAIHTNFVLEKGLQLIQKPYGRADLLRRVREALSARHRG